MTHTQLLFRDEARAKLLAGATVRVTLGPKSKSVMFERGIIDPVKVVRVGLENAASVAGVLLLSEATLTEIEENAKSWNRWKSVRRRP